MLHEPELARAELRILCATCRQIELFEDVRSGTAEELRAGRGARPQLDLLELFSRAGYQEPSVAPSMLSLDDQPSVSDDQPSASTFGAGAGTRGEGAEARAGSAVG